MRKINPWPIIILALLLLGISLALWTIITASGATLVDEDEYLSNYHEVDKNHEEINRAQAHFFSTRAIDNVTEGFNYTKDTFTFVATNNDGSVIQDLITECKVGRYETKADDKMLKSFIYNAGKYTSEEFALGKLGRYEITCRFQDKDAIGYQNFYVYADGKVSMTKDLQRHDN